MPGNEQLQISPPPTITYSKYFYPIEYEYSIFVLFLLLKILFVPKLFGPLNF